MHAGLKLHTHTLQAFESSSKAMHTISVSDSDKEYTTLCVYVRPIPNGVERLESA